MILSMVSEEEKKLCYDTDYDEKMLFDRAEPTLKKLKEAGKQYYACAPEWANEEKTAIRFFLNPRDQDKNYWGWVSEKDLLDWVENKGIIPGHGRVFERTHQSEYKTLQNRVNKGCGLN